MGDTPVGDVKMALPALDRRHFRWILMRIMTVSALVFLKGRVHVFCFGFICVAIRAGPVPESPEQFITRRGVGFVASVTVGTE